MISALAITSIDETSFDTVGGMLAAAVCWMTCLLALRVTIGIGRETDDLALLGDCILEMRSDLLARLFEVL